MTDVPTYSHVKDDGAPFRCTDCDRYRHAGDVWYVILPNGWRGVICTECLDPDWKAKATFNPRPI